MAGQCMVHTLAGAAGVAGACFIRTTYTYRVIFGNYAPVMH